MSGHAESTVLSPATAAQYAFLPKPFTPERLARKVREVLDGGEQV
jgi:DNA-binding NtrC family response regulator